MQAGKEPTPCEDRAGNKRRRPDELVIELAGIGRSADQAQHRSADGQRAEAGDDILGGEDPELLLVTSDVDLHDLLIGEMNTLASLGPPQPIGRKKGQTAKAMKAAATHAAQKPATAKANRGFQAPSRCAARSETDR